MDAFRAWLVVRARNGEEISRTQVLETEPSEFAFVEMLGKTRWTSSTRLVLIARDGSEVGVIEAELE